MRRAADIPDYRRIEGAMADGQRHLDDPFTFEGQREETKLPEEMQRRLVEWLQADGFTVSEKSGRKKISWRSCTPAKVD